MDLLTGAAIVEEAIARAPEPHRAVLADCVNALRSDQSPEIRTRLALDPALLTRMERCLPDRSQMTFYPKSSGWWWSSR